MEEVPTTKWVIIVLFIWSSSLKQGESMDLVRIVFEAHKLFAFGLLARLEPITTKLNLIIKNILIKKITTSLRIWIV